MNILVYKGNGVSQSPLENVLNVLRKYLSNSYDIMTITPKRLLDEPWEETTKLLVIPGGRDIPYCEDLKDAGIRKIQRYIHAYGGSYLGICAGAYFGAEKIEFEKGRLDYEIIGNSGRLGLTPSAVGCVAAGFVYGTEEGATMINLKLEQNIIESSKVRKSIVGFYVNGGPCFPELNKEKSTILASYPMDNSVTDVAKGQPAILEIKYGKGVVILTGVHIEFHMEKDSTVLDTNEKDRLLIFKDLLKRLNLKTESETKPVDEKSENVILLPKNVKSLPIVYFLDKDDDKNFENIFTLYKSSLQLLDEKTLSIIGYEEADDFIKKQFRKDSYNNVIISNNTKENNNLKEFILNQQFLNLTIDKEDKSSELKCIAFTNYHILDDEEKKSLLYFNISLYKTYLPNRLKHKVLLYAPHIPSSQTLLEKNNILRKTLEPYSMCVVSHQTSGRGRGTNSWISQLGCLQFSLILPNVDSKGIVFLQYICVLALCESLRSFEVDESSIKWPNDLYLSNKKISGALITCSWNGEAFDIIIGIGINIDNQAPTYSINQYLRSMGKDELKQEKLLADLFTRIHDMINEFIESDYNFSKVFSQRYYNCWLHNGQQVALAEYKNMRGTITGINNEGFLSVRGENNVIYSLQPDGNSFDMMKGLILRKR